MSIDKLISIGDSVAENGNPDDAVVYYMVACSRSDDSLSKEDARLCAMAHLSAGRIFYRNYSYARALEFFVKGLKVYESAGGGKDLCRFYNNIGTIYSVFQDFEKGLEYYKTGYHLARKYGDVENEYKLLTNMTGICTFQGDVENARHYWKMSEKVRNSENADNLFMSKFNHMLILMAEGKNGEALTVANECLEYSRLHKVDPRYKAYVYQNIYRMKMSESRMDDRISLLDSCLYISSVNNLREIYAETLRNYAGLYAEKGDYRKSYHYSSLYNTLADSIYDVREFDVAKHSQFVYEMDKINRNISDLHEKERIRLETIGRQRMTIFLVLTVAVLVMFLLLVVYRQKRKLDRSYNDLYQVNRSCVEQHELMQTRFREVSDRLKKCLEEKNGVDKGNFQDMSSGCMERYTSSNLSESRNMELLEAIGNVMENTEEYCKADFTLDRLAELVASNSKYVSQVINDAYGKNFSSYVNEYRIRKACIRLADNVNFGQFTIKAIGESVGFRSYSTFTGVFRKITGLTPSLYQEKSLEENTRTELAE